MNPIQQSIYNNAFSLAKWDGATDAEADRIAESAIELEEAAIELRQAENTLHETIANREHVFAHLSAHCETDCQTCSAFERDREERGVNA